MILTILLIAIIAIAIRGFLWWFGDLIVFGLLVWGVIKLVKYLKKK